MSIEKQKSLHQNEKISLKVKEETSVLKQEIEQQNMYTLSKEDFQKYFEGNDFSQWIGNCYLVAVIDSLVHLENYEQLIRKNVKKTHNWFDIILPLWDLSNTETNTYSITTSDLKEQIDIYGKKTTLINWKIGIQALVLAYTESLLETKEIDIQRMEGGGLNMVIKDLIPGMNVYTEAYDWLWDKGKFYKNMKQVIESFDPKKDILVFWVGIWDEIGELKNDISNHWISIKKVEKKNNDIYITYSDPNEAKKLFTIPFNELFIKCSSFYLWSYRTRDINRYSYDEHKFMKNYKKYITVPNKSLNGQIISTQKEDIWQQIKRGDVIITSPRSESTLLQLGKYGNIILQIKSYGSNATTEIKTDEKNNRFTQEITIGNKKLELPLEVEKDKFLNKLETVQQYYKQSDQNNLKLYLKEIFLYSTRLVTFIMRMKHDYIDTQMQNTDNPKPFSIDKEGNLVFDDKISLANEKRRVIWNLLWNTPLVVLKDWSVFTGLTQQTSYFPEKIELVNFLNQLIK